MLRTEWTDCLIRWIFTEFELPYSGQFIIGREGNDEAKISDGKAQLYFNLDSLIEQNRFR